MAKRLESVDELETWLATRPGVRVVETPVPKDTTQAATLLAHIQGLAAQHGWVGMHMFNPTGDDQGLHCVLIRDVVIIAECPSGAMTAGQVRWLNRLRATGSVEVYVWRESDRAAITARLSRLS